MHRTVRYKRITWVVVLLFHSIAALATGGDSSGKSTKPLPVTNTFTGSTVNTTNRTFAQLDQYISGQQFSVQGAEFTEQFFEQLNAEDPAVAHFKGLARDALKNVDNSNSYIDYLSPSDINKLPVGLRKKVGNTEVTIAVSSAVFKPNYAELTAFARVRIPQDSKELLFGVSGLKLSYKGGIIGDAKLVLLGDIAIPINGDKATLILRGGMSMETGQADTLTYITLDCNGFKQLGLTADVKFPRSMIVPANDQGTILAGLVTAGFKNVKVSDWNDIIATVSFATPFQVKGLEGINFTVTTAAFDFSDIHNNPDISYPQGYQQKYLDAENVNAWRGVYVKKLTVGLPKAFKNRDDSSRVVTFGADDLIIDNNGITGLFFAENVLPITKGTASGWKFSVDSIRLALEANHLTRAGFGGRIGLPLSKNNDYDTTNKRKFLAYSAVITANSDYVCRVTTLDQMDFDIWKAKVVLFPNSYIQLVGNGSSFKPEAMLHGKMGIVANSDDNPGNTNPVANMQGIEFKSLHLTTEHISAQYFGYTGEVKLGNFPVSISNIALESDTTTNELAIALNLNVNLHENQFSGSTRFKVIGKMEEGEGLKSWSYSKLKIEQIKIKADVQGAFLLDGTIDFMDNHPVYGNGFKGKVHAEFKKGMQVIVDVNVMFGKKETFRYWYVDGKADLGTGVGNPIKVQGFGGGAYYRMKKDGWDPAFNSSGTGVNYVPDSTAGIGIKACVIFSVASKKIAKGEASFEIAFNRGGGMRYLGFFGYAKVLGEIPGLAKVDNFVAGKLKEVDELEKSLNIDTATLNRLKVLQPSAAAQKTYKSSEKPGEVGLSAYVGIQYDFDAKTLHASFDMYINAAGGMITGAASENRAGWAVLHLAPDKWYLHIGRPDDRLGVKIGIAGLSIRTGSYFMAGDSMPPFPEPPSNVISILRESGLEYDNNINTNDISGGRGLAFGASIEINTGDLRFLFFYAKFSAGLGFDVMIKDYGDAHCEGSSSRIGINGWHAQGQAYAYLQGELGVKVKLLFIKKNIPIIKGGAAALLQAKIPNPTWVGGYMGFYVNILGGAIKGRFNFKFSFGSDCKIVQEDNPNEFDDFQVVSNITPEDQTQNVSILTSPQVKFSIVPGKTMEAPREDGSGNDIFMPMLESFKLYEGSNEVAGNASFNAGGDVLTMTPQAVLKPNTSYKVVARVTMRQLVNGYWVPLSENGQVAQEEKQVTFTTGAMPDSLPHSLIKNMYPFFGMRNLYKDENNKGIIKLNQDFGLFFGKFAVWKVRVEDLNGSIVAVADVTHNSLNQFNFAVPTGLQTGTTYRMRLMGEQPIDPNADPAKPQLNLIFVTSRYNTLTAKIQALNTTQSVVNRVSSDVIDLQAVVAPYEGFELYELAGINYTDYKPMVQGEADGASDAYYQNILKPIVPLYSNSNDPYQVADAAAKVYGTPPFKAITPAWYYITMLQSKEYNNLLQYRMPFIHNTNKYFNLQFLDLRKQIIRDYLGENYGVIIDPDQHGRIPDQYKKLCNEGFPFMLKGKYKVWFTLVQFDGTRSAPAEFNYENPIE